MATRQSVRHTKRAYAGKALIVLSLLALLADLSFLATPIERLMETFKSGLTSLVPSLGLSFLSLTRAIAFHQVDYLSLVSRILVLFFAVVAVVVGIALLLPQSSAAGAGDARFSAFREQETNNGTSR